MAQRPDEDEEDIYTVTVVNPTTPPKTRKQRKIVTALPDTPSRTSNPSSLNTADLVRALKF